ncbi:hypothetical protein DPMN_031952 [Dreissena polymorpha]|uniref:Uncharacterized protein n=1 Tax=Dreissena polymorpha TaxID=45954 RepID=A0A9D4RHS7_DREPO|nr:hypothetical protein DPMN_031952 [Dreissena polymorpha]
MKTNSKLKILFYYAGAKYVSDRKGFRKLLHQELMSDIIGTNIVTKIIEDRKNAPPPSSYVFQPIVTIFELIQDIIETYILAKFYEDWNINVASRILELSSGNHL